MVSSIFELTKKGERRVMLNPKVVAQRVKEMIDDNYPLSYACESVARIFNIRVDDVKIAAVTNIEELYNKWLPNERRREADAKQTKNDM